MPACGVMCFHSLVLWSSVRLSKAHFEYQAERLVAAVISVVISFFKFNLNEFLASVQRSITTDKIGPLLKH